MTTNKSTRDGRIIRQSVHVKQLQDRRRYRVVRTVNTTAFQVRDVLTRDEVQGAINDGVTVNIGS